jgi:hypothetical protein
VNVKSVSVNPCIYWGLTFTVHSHIHTRTHTLSSEAARIEWRPLNRWLSPVTRVTARGEWGHCCSLGEGRTLSIQWA